MVRLLLLCLALTACAPSGGELASAATGLSGSYSRQVVISDHPHHVLYGHVVDITDGQDRTRALIVSQRRDGVHRLRLNEAWADGRSLPYRRMNRRLGCTHGHCRNDAVGMILLGEGMINRSARNGLGASLIGPEGRIDIYAPPGLFTALMAPPQQT